MTRYTTTSSRPNDWVSPRPRSGLTREYVHGPLQSMDYAERLERGLPRLRRVSAWLTAAALIGLGALALWHGLWALTRASLNRQIAAVKAEQPELFAQMEAEWDALPANPRKLDHYVTEGRREMGEARWQELNKEWDA